MVFLTALAYSDHIKHERYIEENDRMGRNEREVVGRSKAQKWIPWLYVAILSCLCILAPYVILHYPFRFAFGEEWYMSPLKFPISFFVVLRGVIPLFCIMAHQMITFLKAEPEHAFESHLETSKLTPGENENGESTLVYGLFPLTAPDSIRVIHLYPGSPNDELECTLVSVRLEEQPPYEALSYCWGQRARNRYIKFRPPLSQPARAAMGDPVPATTLAITDTLHNALVELRYSEKERILWIDQICINQEDPTERSEQVKLMQDIYSLAGCALVWLRMRRPRNHLPWLVHKDSDLLGFFEVLDTAVSKLVEDDNLKSDPVVGPETYKVRSKRPLRDMTKEDRAKYGLPDEIDSRWTLFYGVFDAPWFSRVWVVQEVAWPRDVEVYYANLTCSWERFARVMNFVDSLDIQLLDQKRRTVRQFFSRLRALQACRKSTQDRTSQSLDQVLAQHRMAAASDSRDCIYGLMGLASERPRSLKPDYKASTKDAFLQTAKWALCDGRLDILGLCGDPCNPDRPDGLPSWVPDFSEAAGPHSLTGMGMLLPDEFSLLTRFNASGGLSIAPRVGDDDVMVIPGQLIGEVHVMSAGAAPGRDTLEIHKLHTATTQIEDAWLHLADITRENLRFQNIKMDWEEVARKLSAKNGHQYAHTGETMEDAILRTCLLGETGENLERLRPCYKRDLLQLKTCRLLTFGHGCSSVRMGTAIGWLMWLGLFAAEPLLHRYGYDPYPSNNGEYYSRRQLSAERRLFCGTNGLIGLTPRWAVPGDQIFILRGGKVPVILRGTKHDGMYQFIGEAYVHGAMHGEMFELQKCKELLIA